MNWLTFIALFGCTAFLASLIIYLVDYKENHKND